VIKGKVPRISLSEEARQVSEVLLRNSSGRQRPPEGQHPPAPDLKMPVNFFLDSASYRKNLITKGRRLEWGEKGLLEVVPLEDFNQPLYDRMQDQRRRNNETQRSMIGKSKSAANTLPCKDCECCCCDSYCKQCIEEGLSRISKVSDFRMGVQPEYLYQKIREQDETARKLRDLRCHNPLQHSRSGHG
jgi:hypothetical protein